MATMVLENKEISMRPAHSVASITTAIALLLLGTGNAFAVTMKAVLTGTISSGGPYFTQNYDDAFFGDVPNGVLEGEPARFTVTYDVTGLDPQGDEGYGPKNPIRSAKIQVGSFSDPKKVFEFSIANFGGVYLGTSYAFGPPFSNLLIAFRSGDILFQLSIGSSDFGTRENPARILSGPRSLTEIVTINGDNVGSLGYFHFRIFENSAPMSRGTALLETAEFSRVEDMPPSIVPVPHALPLLASALIAFGALASRKRNRRECALG